MVFRVVALALLHHATADLAPPSEVAQNNPLEGSPFEDWKRQDVEGLRREYTASRLALRRWVAAIGAEFKDEDILLKRRAALRPKGRGKGKDKDKDKEEQ